MNKREKRILIELLKLQLYKQSKFHRKYNPNCKRCNNIRNDINYLKGEQSK